MTENINELTNEELSNVSGGSEIFGSKESNDPAKAHQAKCETCCQILAYGSDSNKIDAIVAYHKKEYPSHQVYRLSSL